MKKRFTISLISLMIIGLSIPATTFADDEDNPRPTDNPVVENNLKKAGDE